MEFWEKYWTFMLTVVIAMAVVALICVGFFKHDRGYYVQTNPSAYLGLGVHEVKQDRWFDGDRKVFVSTSMESVLTIYERLTAEDRK